MLDEIIEDLYFIEHVLEKKDNLIIITEDEPNDSILTKVRYLFDHDGIYVVIHNIKRLQYNMLNHSLVPKCNVLNNTEKNDFLKKFNIKGNEQLPEISRFDPQALVMCIRPGDITKFTRKSITSLESDYYRVCV
jgi:DNA-directed RNA polymerase subunit H (RpoH/RPB5)